MLELQYAPYLSLVAGLYTRSTVQHSFYEVSYWGLYRRITIEFLSHIKICLSLDSCHSLHEMLWIRKHLFLTVVPMRQSHYQPWSTLTLVWELKGRTEVKDFSFQSSHLCFGSSGMIFYDKKWKNRVYHVQSPMTFTFLREQMSSQTTCLINYPIMKWHRCEIFN